MNETNFMIRYLLTRVFLFPFLILAFSYFFYFLRIILVQLLYMKYRDKKKWKK